MSEPGWMSGDFTGFDEKSIKHLKEVIKRNDLLYQDIDAVVRVMLGEIIPFEPNLKRIGKTFNQLVSSLKREIEKKYPDNQWVFMDGYLKTRI